MPANEDKARSIFLAAMDRTPGQWPAFLDEACGEDLDVRARVEALIRNHVELGTVHRGRPELTVDLPPTERPGTVIGPYKLLEQIGEGGFGAVFMAEQTEPVRRKVALKVLKAGMDTRQVVARFEAERQALAIMDHPNIARVFDGGATPSGRPYFVMELVKGVPITEYCDQNHLTPRQRLELFMQVCHAVQHAHQKGIIHRDIKPSNVLVTVHDTAPVVKVIDFGVAKAMGQELTDKTLFTGFAQMIGTPLYMSPEQAGQSGLDVDTRSDIYSLGVLLYELLTGSTPFTKERFRQAAYEEIRRIIREEEPPKPSTRLSSATESLPSISAQRQTEPAKLTKLVRGELDWIVMKALDKDRGRRYETANGFAMDVQRYLADEAVQACPPSAGYRFRKFARRNRGRLVAASVLALAVLVATSGIGWAIRDRSARQAEAERERNERQAHVTTQVELILADVDRLMEAQKWPEALSTAKRAEAALAGGEIDDATREKVAEVIRDLQFVEKLERIHSTRLALVVGKYKTNHAAKEYQNVFKGMGLDTSSQASLDAFIDHWSNRPSLRIPVAAALDGWGDALRERNDLNQAERIGLEALARRLDPDQLRERIRSYAVQPITPELQAEIQSFADGLDVHQHRVETLVTLSMTLKRLGLRDVRLRLLRRTQTEYPGDFWIASSIAGHLQGDKKSAEAESYARVAVAIQPLNPVGYNNLGLVLAGQKKNDEAIASFRKSIDLEPLSPHQHNNLGAVLHNQGAWKEANASYRRALELDPSDATPRVNVGSILLEQRKTQEAIECYRKALEIDPKFVVAHNKLGTALLRLKKPDEAIVSFQKAIELNPTDAISHCNIGEAFLGQGKLDEAITWFRKTIELDPRNAPGFRHLGDALQRQGALDEASKCFRKAIEIDPGDAFAHNSLGIACFQQGNLNDALAHFRKAIEIDSYYAYPASPSRVAQSGRRQLANSILNYRRAVEANSKNVDAHLHLGVGLIGQGNIAEAAASFRKIVELDPTHPDALASLAWILVRGNPPKLRNNNESLLLARRLVAIRAGFWDLDILSLAAYRCSEWRESQDARQKMIAFMPARAEDKLFLAMNYWHLGSRVESRELLAEAAGELGHPSGWLLGVKREADQLIGKSEPVSAHEQLTIPPRVIK